MENGRESLEDESEVVAERLVGHVIEIDAQFVGHDDVHVIVFRVVGGAQQFVFVAVTDGGGVGDAGADVQDVPLFRGVELHVFADFGPRPHQAHVAGKHIDELRQLVQFVFADEIARARDARVVAAYGNQAFFICPDPHGAEFEKSEILSVPSYAGLSVEDGAFGVAFNPQGHQDEQRAEDEQSDSACNYIKKTFQRYLILK